MKKDPNLICIKLDISNCYNSQSRRASLDVICNTEEISHLQTFAAAILAPINSLEAGGEVWGSMGTGLPQGDPASGAFQAFGLQPSLVRLDEECRAGGGMARAGADDICALARPEVAYAAVKRFSDEIWQRCGLEIRWDKSEVYQREGDLPDYAMAGLTLAGEEVDGDFLRGTVFFGVPIGSPEFVSHKLHQLKDSIVSDAVRTREVLGSDRQALWTALRLSVQQRFQYWMQLVPPSLCEPVAVELDAELWRVLEAATGFSIPRGEEEGGLCLRVPQVPSLDRCSYQEWVVRLPVRLYGWGLRSLADSCGPAYLGTLETALPYMAGLGDICPLLAESWGGPECFGEAANPAERWRVLLSSGCSEGAEVRRVWERLQREATASAAWLGEEVPSVLTVPVEGIGSGSVSGETRGHLVTALENLRSKVLGRALEEVRPRSTRAVLAWRQQDKVSSAWRLALPGGETNLSNAEFAEAAATNLCLPSPACHGRVGEPIRGRATIDTHGDNIQASPLSGDHWRQRHNMILHLLHNMCSWAGVQCSLEVFNLFSGHIRQEGLSRLEQHQQRQGLVPDMRISVPRMPAPFRAGDRAGGRARGRAGLPWVSLWRV